MATPQLSPGVITREIDLTTGAVGNVTGVTGAFVGPFKRGPVETPTIVSSEASLLNTFGSGSTADNHYEYWLSASSFLSYGGDLLLTRCDSTTLRNSSVGFGSTSTNVKIKNFDDYSLNYEDDPSLSFLYAAKEPGSWADGLKVAVIDDYADLIIGIATTAINPTGVTTAQTISPGKGIKKDLTNVVVPGIGVTSLFNGYLKGIVTGIKTNTDGTNSELHVKVLSKVSYGVTSHTAISTPTVSVATTSPDTTIFLNSTVGIITGDKFTGGTQTRVNITGVGATSITIASGIGATVNVGASVTIERQVFTPGTETPVLYSLNNPIASFNTSDTFTIVNSDDTTARTLSASNSVDWYNEQKISLSTGDIYWKSIAPRLQTNTYVATRGGSADAMHIAIFDDSGSITGIQGNLVEKWTSLSKAFDAVSAVSSPSKLYYKKLLATNSSYIYVGKDPSNGADALNGTIPAASGFSSGFNPSTGGVWGQNAQGVNFNVVGNKVYTLNNGFDYGTKNGMSVTLGDLSTSYEIYEDTNRYVIDFLIQGPGLATEEQTQAKASKLISIAEVRKDCVAVVSPHRENVVDVNNSNTQTANVIRFFDQIPSSSYAVFDSGYKLTYDRFSDSFKYLPCNPDVAGLMVRTTLNQYPWFSPAGLQRGAINNAIRLAYNPTKAQRDLLYSSRVNPIINQPGTGAVLFGDKTGLSYASAFDRINVRKLFLFVERSIESLAQAQLFQFNDEITRSSFVNLVEPFLRDIQTKRGLYEFLVRCDESNNTPDVIDNNEFRADIYLKPTRSINYVTITFIATRTGASFSEYTG